jgi:hypothetical protein
MFIWKCGYEEVVDCFMEVAKQTPIIPMTTSETGQMDGWMQQTCTSLTGVRRHNFFTV